MKRKEAALPLNTDAGKRHLVASLAGIFESLIEGGIKTRPIEERRRLTENVSPKIAKTWNPKTPHWMQRMEIAKANLQARKKQREKLLKKRLEQGDKAAGGRPGRSRKEEGDQENKGAEEIRRSARQAASSHIIRPWQTEAILKRQADAKDKADEGGNDGKATAGTDSHKKVCTAFQSPKSKGEGGGGGGKTSTSDLVSPGTQTPTSRPRAAGRTEVQVFRDVLPKEAIDLFMNGERKAGAKEEASSSNTGGRNPWPGVKTLCEQMFQRSFAMNFRHPYIAEISSRCDSSGPPQRLDMKLTPSGIQSLLPTPAIVAIEAIIYGLKKSLQFTSAIKWNAHLVLVLPGAPEQVFHVDSSRSWFYHTLLMPLTKDPINAGKTEFWDKKEQPDPPVVVGDCLCFNGKTKHRGMANNSKQHVRVFLYVAAFSGSDYN